LSRSRDLGSLGDFSSSATRRAGVLFQWKGSRGGWAGAIRGPRLRPWPVGDRSSHGSVRGSELCTSCVLLLRVHECEFRRHPASSNKSALRLRYFRRSGALRDLRSRVLCCFFSATLCILCWAFRRGYTPPALRAGCSTFGGPARNGVKPFLISRTNHVVVFLLWNCSLCLTLGVVFFCG